MVLVEDAAAGIAELGILDLDDLGTEPGQRLRAGWPCLELREVEHPHTLQAVQGLAVRHHVASAPVG